MKVVRGEKKLLVFLINYDFLKNGLVKVCLWG